MDGGLSVPLLEAMLANEACLWLVDYFGDDAEHMFDDGDDQKDKEKTPESPRGGGGDAKTKAAAVSARFSAWETIESTTKFTPHE